MRRDFTIFRKENFDNKTKSPIHVGLTENYVTKFAVDALAKTKKNISSQLMGYRL